MLKLIRIDNQDLSPERLRAFLEEPAVVLAKGFCPRLAIDEMKTQILAWSSTLRPQPLEDQYPADIRNLHLEIKNLSDRKLARDNPDIDYLEEHTRLFLKNYRIGDIYHPEIRSKVPAAVWVIESLLKIYAAVLSSDRYRHGNYGGSNLFFEIAHYSCHGGFIEKHTHFKNLNAGQRYNMLLSLSQRGDDFEEGGLYFEHEGALLDLSNEFEAGDLLWFRMDLPHGVHPVRSTRADHFAPERGRWTMSTFYY